MSETETETSFTPFLIFPNKLSSNYSLFKKHEDVIVEYFEQIQGSESHEEFGVSLGKIASNEDLNTFLKSFGDRSRCVRADFKNSSIFIYEIPLELHSNITSDITVDITLYNQRISGNPRGLIQPVGDSRFKVHGQIREPDNGMRHLHRAVAPGTVSRTPQVIVEVAVSQSLSRLMLSAQEWLTDPLFPVEMFIGIKIYKRRANGRAAMLAMTYFRDNPLIPRQVISFGTCPLDVSPVQLILDTGIPETQFTGVGRGVEECNALGLPEFQLVCPAAVL